MWVSSSRWVMQNRAMLETFHGVPISMSEHYERHLNLETRTPFDKLPSLLALKMQQNAKEN